MPPAPAFQILQANMEDKNEITNDTIIVSAMMSKRSL